MMLLIEEYQHQSVARIELSQIALILDLAFGFFATAIVWFRLPLVAGVLKNQPNETLSDKKFTVKIIAILATIFSICLVMWVTQITANALLLWGIVLSSTYACADGIQAWKLKSMFLNFARKRYPGMMVRKNSRPKVDSAPKTWSLEKSNTRAAQKRNSRMRKTEY